MYCICVPLSCEILLCGWSHISVHFASLVTMADAQCSTQGNVMSKYDLLEKVQILKFSGWMMVSQQPTSDPNARQANHTASSVLARRTESPCSWTHLHVLFLLSSSLGVSESKLQIHTVLSFLKKLCLCLFNLTVFSVVIP